MTDRPLRILHLTHGSEAGGVTRYICDLSQAMRRRGHEIVVAGQRAEWHDLMEKANIAWIDMPIKGGPLALIRCVRVLRAYLAAHPVDVIHTHYRRGTVLARVMQFMRKVPILYTVHLSHFSLAWPRRPLSDFGDHTHVASLQTRAWLTEDGHLPPRMITVIPHGIDTAKFPPADAAARAAARAALGLEHDDIVAAYVGRLDYPKNETWLLDVAAEAQKRPLAHRLRILIAGDGPHRRQLQQSIDSRGLHEIVRLLGFREPLGVYQALDALLLPSKREGFSLTCAEAMSVGVPVLRTRTAGTVELIVENVTGRSVAIDHDAFVAGALEFLGDAAALKRMGQAAARHVHAMPSFEQRVDETVQLYRFLMTKRQRH